jgi:hypothetical protein
MPAPLNDPMVNYFKSEDVQINKPAYVLVTQRSPEEFSAAVSKLIVEGQYKPVGGVFVAMSNDSPVFCQAMILGKLL